MIIRNFTVIHNTVINTVMSYQTCRQVLNKYCSAPLSTSCLIIEYICQSYLHHATDIITCLTDEQKHPFVLRSWNSYK